MAKEYFDFRQFRIRHDRCGQKVGTDGVLLGAWAPVEGARRILDIGTGSGLLALMVAQRVPEAQVTGVDVDAEAVVQAQENVARSPFSERIRVLLSDVRDYAESYQGERYGHIVCNPPFYTAQTLPPDARRAVARNASGLPFGELVGCAARLLETEGVFSVVLPTDCQPEFTRLCAVSGLHPVRLCLVQTVARKAAKRCLISYARRLEEWPQKENLILQDGQERSEGYKRLTREFYL